MNVLNFVTLRHFPVQAYIQGVSAKSSPPPPKTFWNILLHLSLFVWNFCRFVAISYPHLSTNFCRFILIFHQMALIFPRVPSVFTLSSFEYSPIKWKCCGGSPTAWFTQNGWASVVDLTADFLNSAQLSSFVNWKWWLSHQVLAHEASACAVCHCKTVFPLVGPTKL